MDEWIGAGDASFQDKVVERMNSFFESADICVIASHNNRLLRKITNRCLWLEAGRVRAIGTTAEVLDAYEAEAMPSRTASEPAISCGWRASSNTEGLQPSSANASSQSPASRHIRGSLIAHSGCFDRLERR